MNSIYYRHFECHNDSELFELPEIKMSLLQVSIGCFGQGHTDGHLGLFHRATGTLLVGDHCVG